MAIGNGEVISKSTFVGIIKSQERKKRNSDGLFLILFVIKQ